MIWTVVFHFSHILFTAVGQEDSTVYQYHFDTLVATYYRAQDTQAQIYIYIDKRTAAAQQKCDGGYSLTCLNQQHRFTALTLDLLPLRNWTWF